MLNYAVNGEENYIGDSFSFVSCSFHIRICRYSTIGQVVGTHADAAPYYEKLLLYIKQCGYSVVDDVIEITYIDYGLTNNISRFVTEIQIPLNQ